MQKDATEVHLDCCHFGFNHLLFLHAVDFQHLHFPLFGLLDGKKQSVSDELHEDAAQNESLCHFAVVEPIQPSSVCAEAVDLVKEVVMVDGKRQRQVAICCIAQDVLKFVFLQHHLLHPLQELKQEQFYIPQVKLIVVIAVVLFSNDEFGSFCLLHPLHLLLSPALAYKLRYLHHVPFQHSFPHLLLNLSSESATLRTQVLFAVRLEPFYGEPAGVTRQEQVKVDSYHCYPELPDFGKVVFFSMRLRLLFPSPIGPLYRLLGIHVRMLLMSDGLVVVRRVAVLGVRVVGLWAVVVAVALLLAAGHHHLHIKHALVVDFDEGTNDVILFALAVDVLPLVSQRLDLVLHPLDLIHEFT